jgi:peptidoglycan/LPS O-acetylase OafA/YrhL
MSKLPNIQILRAVAASLVVLYHCAIETTTVCTETGQSCSYDFWPGGYGVALFFVISALSLWRQAGTPSMHPKPRWTS